MEAVDFRYLFIGIETSDKDLLVRAQKKQNTRNLIVEGVQRLNASPSRSPVQRRCAAAE
jgi:radical SAM superfamily enzyme YgiQ (UPF0313 family)